MRSPSQHATHRLLPHRLLPSFPPEPSLLQDFPGDVGLLRAALHLKTESQPSPTLEGNGKAALNFAQKRMCTVVWRPDGRIKLFCKGARQSSWSVPARICRLQRRHFCLQGLHHGGSNGPQSTTKWLRPSLDSGDRYRGQCSGERAEHPSIHCRWPVSRCVAGEIDNNSINNPVVIRVAIENARSLGRHLYVVMLDKVDIDDSFPSINQAALWVNLANAGAS